MANFPPLYKNTTGDIENLRTADGGLEINVLAGDSAAAAVSLFDLLDNTGSLSMFAAYDSTCTIGAASSVFTFGGGVTVTENLTVTANCIFNGDVDLGNGAGDAITITGSVDSNITFENSSARTITVDSQALTLSTTTSGILNISSPTEVQIDTYDFDLNATNGVQIDAAVASQLVVSGATDDLTLGARGTTIDLNALGDTALDSNFTAASLIGALNELKVANLGTTTPVYPAGEAIVAGDVVYIDYDGASAGEVLLADNAVSGKRNPVGIALNGGVATTPIYIATQGQEAVINSVIAGTNEGEQVYLDTAGAVTLTPPAIPPFAANDTSQIIGIVTVTGAAGTAKIIVQMRPPVKL